MSLGKANAGLRLGCSIGDCHTMKVTAPSPGVTEGQFAVIGNLVGVYATTAATGSLVTFIYKAPHITLPCVTANTAGYAVGSKIYYDSGQSKLTKVSTGKTLCGFVKKASAVGDTTLEIELDGALGVVS